MIIPFTLTLHFIIFYNLTSIYKLPVSHVANDCSR